MNFNEICLEMQDNLYDELQRMKDIYYSSRTPDPYVYGALMYAESTLQDLYNNGAIHPWSKANKWSPMSSLPMEKKG